MNRRTSSLVAATLLAALVPIPAGIASAETVDGCAAVQAAPLDRELVAGSGASNNFAFAAPDSTSAELGHLEPGKTYQGSASFSCSDSFYSSFKAVQMGSQRAYVSANIVAEVEATDNLVFDSYVAITAALSLGSNVHSQPSNGSESIGELAGETVYPSTSTTKTGPSSLLGSGDYYAVKFNDQIGWVDSAAVSLVPQDKFTLKETPKPKDTSKPTSAATPTASATPGAKASNGKPMQIPNLWPFAILGTLVAAGVALAVSRRRKTKDAKSKPANKVEEPADAQDD